MGVSTLIVCRHNKFKEIPKIRNRFGFYFLYFKTPVLASLYWPCYLVKYTIILIVFLLVESQLVHIYTLLGFQITVLSLIILRPWKLLSLNLLDISLESFDLIIYFLNVFIITDRVDSAYAFFIIVIACLKVLFICVFTIVYIAIALVQCWKAVILKQKS
jgi:hypothetical protein